MISRLKQKYNDFELYFNKKILIIFALGFVSGLPLALVVSTLSVWLTEVGVSMTAVGFFAAVSVPYTVKFLWAPFMDQLPLPFLTSYFGRRRGWIIFSQILLIAAIIALGMTDPSVDASMTALMAFIVALCSASQDIVIDAYRVEILDEKQQGAGAATIVFGYRIGMLVSGAGALLLADHLNSWFITYVVMAMLIIIGFIAVLFAKEPEIKSDKIIDKNSKNNFKAWIVRAVIMPFSEFMARPNWLMVLAFVVIYKLGDAFAGVMTNPFLIEIGFSKTEIAGVVKTFGLAATLFGFFVGGILINHYGLVKSLLVAGILQMLSNLMFVVQAHMGHDIYMLTVTIAIENFSGGMGTAAFVAYLSGLCNIGYTATQYALLSSLGAVSRTLLSTPSGILVDYAGFANFFLFSTFLAIPGLLLLYLMPKNAGKISG